MKEEKSFLKRFEELKLKNLKTISFKDKLGGYKDFWVVWNIAIWKKWNQIYFISTCFHIKTLDSFFSKIQQPFWFIFINEWITIENYLKWKEKVESFIKNYDLTNYWFQKEEEEVLFDMENELKEITKCENLNIKKKEITLKFTWVDVETVIRNYLDCNWIKQSILFSNKNEVRKKIEITWVEYIYENEKYVDILIKKEFDLKISQLIFDKEEYLYFLEKENENFSKEIYKSQNLIEKLFFKKELNIHLFSDSLMSKYLLEKKEIKESLLLFYWNYSLDENNEKFIINFPELITITPFNNIKEEQLNFIKFKDLVENKNNHYYNT